MIADFRISIDRVDHRLGSIDDQDGKLDGSESDHGRYSRHTVHDRELLADLLNNGRIHSARVFHTSRECDSIWIERCRISIVHHAKNLALVAIYELAESDRRTTCSDLHDQTSMNVNR